MEFTTSQKIIGGILIGVVLAAIYVLMPSSGEDLEGMLRSGDADKQVDAILKLEQRNDEDAAELIQEFSKDRVERVARRCVTAMGRMPDHFTEEQIAEMLNDARESIREAAVLAIGARGLDGNPGILRQVFTNTQNAEGLRSAAARVLGAMSDWEAMDPLIRGMNDPSLMVRAAAQQGVEAIYGRTFPKSVYHVESHPSRRGQFVSSFLNEYKHYETVHRDFLKRKQEQLQ